MKSQFEQLKAPFPVKDIQWRIGRKNKDGTKAEVLAYIDARAIQERIDEVVGPENWSVEYRPVDMGTMTRETYNKTVTENIKGFICTLSIFINDKIITREDGSNCTDNEPFKGGMSGAFKRTASSLGIGRYLYDLDTVWVDIDKYGKFAPPQLPSWALPEGEAQQAPLPKPSQSNNQSTQSQQVMDPSTFTFGGGKHAGKKLSEVPRDYLEWTVNESKAPDNVKELIAGFLNAEEQKEYEGYPEFQH